jgi:hypothetical protein
MTMFFKAIFTCNRSKNTSNQSQNKSSVVS